MGEEEWTESQLERQVGLFFLDRGIFCQRFPKYQSRGQRKSSGPLNLNGSPDLYLIVPPLGRFIGVEIKLPKNKASDEQKEFERLIVKAGGAYFICRSLKDAEKILLIIKERAQKVI